MPCTSWGMYPVVDCQRCTFSDSSSLRVLLDNEKALIPRGNGRSYGDSALNDTVIDVRPHNAILGFTEENGLLHVQAGALLADVLETFVPQGWFLKVTPGTKFITVGGAIASDVHGKNHHVEGCFSECVEEFTIMLPKGQMVTCSPNSSPELFKATCGGMGLTGVILDAKIFLKRINSIHINQTTVKTGNLQETFEAFEAYSGVPYSVAWINCLAKGNALGQSLLLAGDFMDDGALNYTTPRQAHIPFDVPSFAINRFTIQSFNWLYYNKHRKPVSQHRATLNSFFYPLDSIDNWNRIYGSSGFAQYQFILPLETSYQGLKEILTVISQSGRGSFIAVLKLYGHSNANYLSFPLNGYSLSLDFKINQGLFEFLDILDELVLKYMGRLYLTKDVRVSKETFEQGYPHIDRFRQFRQLNDMDKTFQSIQSKRVGI
ncbi:MAG: FAD-linked oxidase [Acidobacteria bacterium]|nr:FAD-linked oxidase [Acidobacteriota bacterium]